MYDHDSLQGRKQKRQRTNTFDFISAFQTSDCLLNFFRRKKKKRLFENFATFSIGCRYFPTKWFFLYQQKKTQNRTEEWFY